MRVSLLACLVTFVISEESFEEKLKEGNQILKTDPNADDTMEFLQKLHSMKEELKGESTEPNADVLKAMDDYANIKQNNMSVSIAQVNTNSKVATALYQGDIMLTREQADEIMEGIKEDEGNRNKRQAYRDEKYPKTLWSNGVNYFFYNATRSARRVFLKGAEIWRKDTCLEFKEDSSAEDKVMVIHGAGCWSHVGRLGRTQILSLGDQCDFIGLGIHELGHTIGLFHTQSRHDRDDFITLHFENLLPGWAEQFSKESERTNYNYNITYDYGTAMHYGATAVSKNGRPYMTPHDTKFLPSLGSYILSFYEKLMVNLHYKCLDKCTKESSANCENGGFPHPRDCSKCVCPSGYGGRLCNERPPGCGEILTATESYQELWDVIGNKDYNSNDDNDEFLFCNYWIQAPAGSTIEVIFQNYTENVAYDGCVWAGVEIKTLADKRQTGYRFCSPNYGGTSLVSTHNIVPIITFSRLFEVTSLFRYRIASSGPATSQPTSQQTPQPTSQQTPEPTSRKTPQPTSQQTPEPTSRETPQPTSQQTPEPTSRETPQPTTRPHETSSTSKPRNRCYERKLCSILVKLGLCNSSAYTSEVKEWSCPGSCA